MKVDQKAFDYAISSATTDGQDVADILNVARRSFGIGMSPCEAEKVWRWWSNKHEAQWLSVYTSDIQTAIVEFIREYAP